MIRKYNLHIAWLIAVMSLIISLFSSELYDVPVCKLCWLQRVCLYPLALILGVAAYYEDKRSVIKYAFPLSTLAFFIALYHYLEQMVPGFAPIGACGGDPLLSCTITHFKLLGFITYPFLSMLASLMISVALLLGLKKDSSDEEQNEGENS